MALASVELPAENDLWNGSRQTLEARMEYFVGNKLLSDMTFLVGDDRRPVPGHSFILSSCSWEFFNALHLLKIDNNELPIQDVPYAHFLVFLDYCYTGNVILNQENAISILKLAYRFDMKPLIAKCETEMLPMLTGENFMEFYSQSNGFLPKESPVRIKLLDIIAVNFRHLMDNESVTKIFLELPLETVDEIASVKSLPCDEVIVFKTLIKWAAHACEKSAIPSNPLNLRKILRHVLYKIRFPTLTSLDFLEVLTTYSGILSCTDINRIAGDIVRNSKGEPSSSTSTPTFPFANVNRKTDEHKIAVPWPESEIRELVPTCSISFTNSAPDECWTFLVTFKVTVQKRLSGFALITRNPYGISSAAGYLTSSCAKCREKFNKSCTCVTRKMCNVGQKHALSYDLALNDYVIFPIIFKEEAILNPDVCYKLYTDFNVNKPGVSNIGVSKTFSGSDLIVLESSNSEAIIPFLYFAK